MRTIVSITPLDDFLLLCTFSDGITKIADTKELLNGAAFQPLKDKNEFIKVENHQYFVLWPDHELDLSSDTLWHIGEETNTSVITDKLLN